MRLLFSRYPLIALALLAQACSLSADTLTSIPADSEAIGYSGYVKRDWVPAPEGHSGQAAQFQRILGLAGKAYGWDNPGTRIAFRTDASAVTAHLYYSPKHTSTSGRNGQGLFFIDGETQPEWTFDTVSTEKVREPEFVDVTFPAPTEAGPHTYEIVLPYGDAVEFLGLTVAPGATMETPPPAPETRYVAYGDSITQGFTASSIDHTYPYLIAQEQGWELVNFGLAGRRSNPKDGTYIADLKPDVLTILMGCNDWQGGNSLEAYQTNIEQTLADIRAACPDTEIYLITPLWVPERWHPRKARFPLEEYREVLRGIAQNSSDPKLHLIEGPELIDHEESNFDRVAVHPSDAGFAQMAERLNQRLRQD
jgi:lysophospholipase L1-like esterase